jgi:hypothetical protein
MNTTDYNITDLDPDIWGDKAWFFLHSITLSYPDIPSSQQIDDYHHFFMNIHKVLPCSKCRDNYIRHLQELPLTKEMMQSKENVIVWLFNIHNLVNVENKKPVMEFKDFKRLYEVSYATKKQKDFSLGDYMRNHGVILILFFAILGYVGVSSLRK